MRGNFSSSRSFNSIDGSGTPRPNQLMDINSPMNSPLSDSSLMRFLPPGLLSDSDQFSSPNPSRSIVNYHYYNSRSCSRSPLAAMENLEKSPALVKVEDDVLVMDGILVGSSASKCGGKFRSPASSDSGGNSSDSGSGYLYKTELCLSWEDTGACLYGHKCQFAHGQEELRCARARANNARRSRQTKQPSSFTPQSNRFTPNNQIVPGTLKPEEATNLAQTSQTIRDPFVSLFGKSSASDSNKALPLQSNSNSSPNPGSQSDTAVPESKDSPNSASQSDKSVIPESKDSPTLCSQSDKAIHFQLNDLPAPDYNPLADGITAPDPNDKLSPGDPVYPAARRAMSGVNRTSSAFFSKWTI